MSAFRQQGGIPRLTGFEADARPPRHGFRVLRYRVLLDAFISHARVEDDSGLRQRTADRRGGIGRRLCRAACTTEYKGDPKAKSSCELHEPSRSVADRHRPSAAANRVQRACHSMLRIGSAAVHLFRTRLRFRKIARVLDVRGGGAVAGGDRTKFAQSRAT